MRAETEVYLLGVPDYNWYAGCFGAACGNLMGYWDRHGMQNFYTGPTAGGLAPLNNFGSNVGIRSMWASKAGFDGRPPNQFGHIDDYWLNYSSDFSYSYESTAADPYVLAGRKEHAPDCIADFIGMSQKKWTNLNNECDGNIDAYTFNYWELSGNRRTNSAAPVQNGNAVRELQSGLREWTRSRGYDAVVFSQLTDFNPNVTAGRGFTFNDLKGEIDAGYPVLLFLQGTNQFSRSLSNPDPMPRANPVIHGMLAYGYLVLSDGTKWVRYRTSWGSGDLVISEWSADTWQAGMPLRGVIGFHPLPKITSITQEGGQIVIRWDGPSSQLYDAVAGTTTALHWYEVQKATSLSPPNFVPLGAPTTNQVVTLEECCSGSAFFRVKLVSPP